MEVDQQKAIVGLIRSAMPGVMRLVAEKRREMGDSHVVECQRRGMAGEPGWFFAREGCLAVGTPWADEPVIAQYAGGQLPPRAAFLCIRPLPGTAATEGQP